MPSFSQIKLILTDIEGTTSSIAFVKEVLFPYAAEHLPQFIRDHQQQADVRQQLQATAELVRQQSGQSIDGDLHALTQQLLAWIRADVKATPLKALQGMIWQQGYETAAYQAHMYADATHQLRQWHAQGIPLYVYSSGSVQAQKLFYGYSQDGDLLPLFSGHFDTSVGNKREAQSYRNILAWLQQTHDIDAANILFLSDIEQELDAAADCGMQTCWLVRDEQPAGNSLHPRASDFNQIQLSSQL